MSRMIADASRVGNAILPDENDVLTAQILDKFVTFELCEPSHWPIEIANLVLKASRRGRLGLSERTEARDSLHLLVQSAEIEPVSQAMPAFELAVHHNISVYDAGYLEMALRTGLPLFTSDGPLKDAARRAGAALIELS